MEYWLGIDLGTTFTAAAANVGGEISMLDLGAHQPEMPSVVAVTPDAIHVGDAAVRMALHHPGGIAREFKRRLGDSTPLIINGEPWTAEALMGELLSHVFSEAKTRYGTAPAKVILTHPASWQVFKLDRLQQAALMAGSQDADLVSEPVAAAKYYAHENHLREGQRLAVFDFGGATFDAAVLHAGTDEFTVLGEPKGLDQLGGIDLDQTILAHVLECAGIDLDDLDDTAANLRAVHRLRDDCRAAKEALSSDTTAHVPVMLPGYHTEIRVTRSEFEEKARRSIERAVKLVETTIGDAGLEINDIDSVLLVGGSSRIPYVAQAIGQALGLPVVSDSHPKHTVAKGATLETARVRHIPATTRRSVAADEQPQPQPPAPPNKPELSPIPLRVEAEADPEPDRRGLQAEDQTPVAAAARERPKRPVGLLAVVFASLAVLVGGLVYLTRPGSPETDARSLESVSSQDTTEEPPTSAQGPATDEMIASTVPGGAIGGAVHTYGGGITIGLEAEAAGLRPWEDACDLPCYDIIRTIHDTLFESDANLVPQPFLAESYRVNAEFTEYVVALRPGVTFHNGQALTAQTIVDMFAIQAAGTVSARAISQASLASVTATGDLEVTYTLSRANSAFPSFLARAPIGAVFEPGAAATDPDGYGLKPVGTGPFMIEERNLDNETVVVKNENWWGTGPEDNPLPYLDRITFRPIPDEATRLDLLLAGTVDVIRTQGFGTIREALDAEGIELIQFQSNNTGGGVYNTSVAPLDDVRVRRGLTHLNPQDQVIETLGAAGISVPATQWFSPDSPWYSEAVAEAWPKFDVDVGVALLQEYVDDPGRSDGKAVGEKIDVELSCPPDPTLVDSLQVIEEAWTASELVNVALTNFDTQTHINNALGSPPDYEGVHQAHCWRWSSDDDPSLRINDEVAPPNATVADDFGVPGVIAPSNFSNWANQEAYEASLAATRTDDFAERSAMYERIMMLMAEEVPLWYSGHTVMAFGSNPQVVGLNDWHLPSGQLGAGIAAGGRYHEVSFEEG